MKRRICLIIFSIFILGIASNAKSINPILVLATNANFGVYTGEILKTEGFNEFQIDSLTNPDVSLNYLKQFDIVILTETEITPSQKEMFASFVKGGGNLISFRPDKKLSEIFGIKDVGGTISEGYIGLNKNSIEAKKITQETMQFHGIADIYKLTKGKIIASLFRDANTSSGLPVIVANEYGKGHAVAFLYNLPKSIIYTRQGNPLNAGLEKDGINGLRAMDLFTDRWVNTSKNTINQADEQMRLLTHCIEKMNSYTKPLPRIWYFPDDLKCLVTLTNDGEGQGETDFEQQFADVDAKGAKMSIYILAVNKTSKAWADKWSARGHEIAGHPDDTKEASNPHWNIMDSVIEVKKNEILTKYGITQHTNVNHWFVWCGRDADGKPDFTAEAKLEAKHGIEMDVNYAHYDGGSTQGRFLGPLGYNQGTYEGSGMVMKFCDDNGKIINVYQHYNNVYDQQYEEIKDSVGFLKCFKGLMDRSLNNEVYSYISIKSHNWAYYYTKAPLMKMLDYANKNGIPVWTVLKLLDFMKMKYEAKFNNITWSDNKLSFNLTSSLKHSNKLTFLVPGSFKNLKINGITCNGKTSPFIIWSLKGHNYAFVSVEPGQNYDVTVAYKD
jgi:hypothetical protein